MFFYYVFRPLGFKVTSEFVGILDFPLFVKLDLKRVTFDDEVCDGIRNTCLFEQFPVRFLLLCRSFLRLYFLFVGFKGLMLLLILFLVRVVALRVLESVQFLLN